MDKTGVLQSLAGLFFISILFTPQSSDAWIYFGIMGVVFGTWWFLRLD